MPVFMTVVYRTARTGMDKEYLARTYTGILLSHKKEWNSAVCRDVNGPRDCHTEWSQKEKKQISYINAYAYMWNLGKWYRWIYLQSRNRHTNIENKCMYTKGGSRVGWIGRLGLTHTLLSAAKSLQSCPTLCDPAAHQALRSLGFSRQEHWSGLPFPSPCMKVKSESEVAQSCPTLRDPMDCSPPGSSIHGIFQARVLEWAAI